MLTQILFYIKIVAISRESEGPLVIPVFGVFNKDGDADFVGFLPFPCHMKKASSCKRRSAEVVG